ncbi:hypothetical protein BS47DRAFT_1353361 [Hydnum rufescens UP504]|uniref:Uncharacterized protein n=1 Tax=Hydnum rufescens UP504 TaxID=1448309 RepID=A0A9P6AIB9_9AGAM|nr:hypothetical protein BS47DRAFT_1353361 [Hydnum rufescens UP504]
MASLHCCAWGSFCRLLNFGDKVGKISVGMFLFIAMAIMVYPLVTYHWRASAIRRRDAGPYDDRLGPTVLCVFSSSLCRPSSTHSIQVQQSISIGETCGIHITN